VDFLIKRGADLMAIEVKSGPRFSESWCKGLRAIAKLKRLRRRLIVCPTCQTMKTKDGIEVLSFDSFCRQLEKDKLWSA